jgi:hypothetical protein
MYIIIAVFLGGLRILGFKSQAYQAMAHLYMGWIIAVWWLTDNPLLLIINIVLVIIELTMFIIQHLQRKTKNV